MTIQNTVQMGDVIRHAVAFNIKNWQGKPMNSDSLIHGIQHFFALLEEQQINYVLVGGIALLHYVEGRNTQDLDLLLEVSELEKLPELHITSQDAYFVRATYEELQIDLLLTQNPLFKEVHQNYVQTQPFFDRHIPLATVEGLLLLKLYALPSLYRQGNFARVGLYENDVATLFHYYQPEVATLLTKLAPYLSDTDFKEVQTIVVDIQNRLKRFQK